MALSNNRRFWLIRDHDPSGVSGTGVVAEGIIFDSGKAVLSWMRVTSSVGIYDSITVLEAVHGHEGATRIVYEDDEEG
jgi:hypothetical protein